MYATRNKFYIIIAIPSGLVLMLALSPAFLV